MNAKSRSCPVCDSDRTAPYFSDRHLSMDLCRACGLKFQNPMPTPERLAALYSETYYDDVYPERILAEQERLFDARLVSLAASFGPLSRVLEIGAGRGVFLQAATRRGLSCVGIEPSGPAVMDIRSRLGIEVHQGDIMSVEPTPASFDLVHLNHVLEHIPDPLAALRRVHDLLRPGGILYCEVPRQSNLLNRLSHLAGGFNFHYHPGHLYLFSPASLAMLLRRAGLAVARLDIEGMTAPHRFTRGVHYHSTLAHLVKVAAGGLRLERILGGGNLASVSRRPR